MNWINTEFFSNIKEVESSVFVLLPNMIWLNRITSLFKLFYLKHIEPILLLMLIEVFFIKFFESTSGYLFHYKRLWFLFRSYCLEYAFAKLNSASALICYFFSLRSFIFYFLFEIDMIWYVWSINKDQTIVRASVAWWEIAYLYRFK